MEMIIKDLKTGRCPQVGILEWFRIGEYERAETAIRKLQELGIQHLRTGISWADWLQEEGPAWYAWLMPRLSAHFEVLPCFSYTPPSLGMEAKTASPPRVPKDYADFIDQFLDLHGADIEWVELWNEPNNLSEWDHVLDPTWEIFAETIGGAAYWVHTLGKKAVLGGMSPIDPHWLYFMHKLGVLEHIDAVGIHGFPGTWDAEWPGWDEQIRRVREVLNDCDSSAELWITEAGYSTWRYDEFRQLEALNDVLKAPVERLYWYALQDLPGDCAAIKGFHHDERDYHCGITLSDGRDKLVGRIWREHGLGELDTITRWPRQNSEWKKKNVAMITGGGGFIGSNLATRLLNEGRDVVIFDNLSRSGIEENVRWLLERYPDNIRLVIGDMRNRYALRDALQNVTEVFHLAGQVAVTTSMESPLEDFQINALGTLNLLEELRRLPEPPSLLFTSTNKVYGNLDYIEMVEGEERYQPSDANLLFKGLDESTPLQLYSPYGCSKGAADQYVLDYARHYGIQAVVFRMSCIFGPRQYGTEDQGWVAHFMLNALRRRPITIYGDGKQVRDVLYVDDLINAMLLARAHSKELAGQAFNIGGGPGSTLSLLELLGHIERLQGYRPIVRFDGWRAGDQRYYVSGCERFRHVTGWAPEVDLNVGLEQLHRWLAWVVKAGSETEPADSSVFLRRAHE